jgi:hypothetical protein
MVLDLDDLTNSLVYECATFPDVHNPEYWKLSIAGDLHTLRSLLDLCDKEFRTAVQPPPTDPNPLPTPGPQTKLRATPPRTGRED